jgi:uncharacterized Zn finger protein
MKSVFDDAVLPVPCPKCGKEHKLTIAFIKANDETRCNACGTVFSLDSHELTKELNRFDRSVNEFRKLSNKTFKL